MAAIAAARRARTDGTVERVPSREPRHIRRRGGRNISKANKSAYRSSQFRTVARQSRRRVETLRPCCAPRNGADAAEDQVFSCKGAADGCALPGALETM